jgi:hypothetical protein
MASQAANMSGRSKRCFVVMGFGVKTDHATGRTLNLDKPYRLLVTSLHRSERRDGVAK